MSVQQPIHRSPLHDELVILLRNMIIEGELRPEGRIAESRLCDHFGVSRTPLREAPKAIRRIVAGALIASTILLGPSASRALDNVTLITEFGFNGRHAFSFVALDRGYYRDAGLDVKIVRGQGAVDAIRQVGAGNAMFGFADAGTVILARAND